MDSENQNRSHISPRPTTGEHTYRFGSSKNENSTFNKIKYEQIDSKGLKDPFIKYYRISEFGVEIIKPLVNPYALANVVQENSFLLQCIEAMVVNIHGFGYRFEYVGKEKSETSSSAKEELQYIEEIFDHPNTYMSFQELRERIAWDYWVFGNAYIEVTRDNKGRIATMHHLPATTMRITKIDVKPTPIKEYLTRSGQQVSFNSKKNFRRFVQLDDFGKRVFFKELGDPRIINTITGVEDTTLSPDDGATEIIHLARYNGKSVYGLPIWYTQLPSIQGSRQAELTNLDFFENNAVPALAILVSGGYLTEEAFDYLRSNFESVKGRGSTNKVLVIEARGAVEDSSSTGAVPVPTVKLEPLYAQRQNDALFQEYEKNCADKVRSIFRLPNVFVGAGDEQTTYASAKVSLEVAENQIFVPERIKFDEMINSKVLSTWNFEYWRFRSNPAAIVTADDLFKAIETFGNTAAMTPNVAIGMLNEKMNLDIPKVNEFWGDMPYDVLQTVMEARAGPDQAAYLVKAMEILNCKTVDELLDIDVAPPPNVTISEQGNPASVSETENGNVVAKPATTVTSIQTVNAKPQHVARARKQSQVENELQNKMQAKAMKNRNNNETSGNTK
jgi:PBSX family phage portal protein